MGCEEKKKQKKMKANRKRSKSGGDDEGKPKETITDERFASVFSDPRFMEAPKKSTKVVLDSRFRPILTDSRFISSKAPVDKYGKPKDKKAAADALKRYYRLDKKDKKNDEEEDENSDGGSLSGSDSEKLSNAVEEGEDDDVDEDSSDESSLSTSSTDDSDDESLQYDEEEEYNFLQPEENVPDIDKETRRLAIVNLDWSQIRAVDLYVLLSSFLPKGGQICSVAVYPSEFGLKRMEEEAVRGPLLFDGEKKDNEEGNDDDGDEDEDEIDNRDLRAYELSKLRYYYAVVECDSISTADFLYKECDGIEVERSANKLDLRFIPDSMEFKHQPRDVATEAPMNYEGVLDFETKALTKSDVPLTWDEDDDQPRKRAMRRMFKSAQDGNLDITEYLTSDESDPDDEDNADGAEDKKHKKRERYLSLIQNGDGSDEDEEKANQDMEVTFNSGLEDITKHILEKKDKKSESVWEATLRKQREKKKLRRNRSKNSSEDESSGADEEAEEQEDDFFIEEPSTAGIKDKNHSTKKGTSSREIAQVAEASTAELELLLAGEEGTDNKLKGYNLKSKKSKRKKGQEIPEEVKMPAIDFSDPRFSVLLTSPLFALDPTDPQFKRSATYARQMALKQKVSDQEDERQMDHMETSGQVSEVHKDEPVKSDEGAQKHKNDLSAVIRSLKMKSKQIPLPSQVKVSRKHEHLLHEAKKQKKEK